jgi:H+-translocating NAD(P) transhydrogenase subunit beta
MQNFVLQFCYLLGSISFIVGLKMLSKPNTASKGNLLAAAGMGLAIFATIFLYQTDGEYLQNKIWIFAALLVGTVAGWYSAVKVKMTAMPEMVSLFNGMGGACAMLISIMEFKHVLHQGVQFAGVGNSFWFYIDAWSKGISIPVVLGLVIGAISFAGSIIAWGKLNGRIKDVRSKALRFISMAILLLLVALCVAWVIYMPLTRNLVDIPFSITYPNGEKIDYAIHIYQVYAFYALLVLSLVYGVLFVLPIGGADMPVVISLLNSFTGMAAAFGGFVYNNKVMLTGGILVGAAGTLLTLLMCKAMNRSLKNVLLGAFGGSSASSASTDGAQKTAKEISLSDAAVVMRYANKVIIVPGYGLAVAQAQHTCHELEKILTDLGVEVKYAIHPVAGRMPGHMNVLLAEADVAYEKLLELEQANDEFNTTDVVLVLGANDVVNPVAKTDPQSPIYGMPILHAYEAKLCIVNKRSMKPGYAGIDNDLFYEPKTSMLFGDAKKVLQDLSAEIKGM